MNQGDLRRWKEPMAKKPDPEIAALRKAQRLAQLAYSERDIAIALGVSLATVKRYLSRKTK